VYCSWMEWMEWMDRNARGDTDIFLATATNRGATWSAPVTVNDESGGMSSGP